MRRYLRLLIVVAPLLLSGCKVNLKPYERVFINDPEMQMQITADKGFQQYVNSIREGAVAPRSRKGNGGCGCN